VNAERGVQDGSEDDELRHALEALMPVAREMVTTLEAAAVHASEMVAKQRRAEALEAEIQRLQEENHQLRTRPLTDTLAPRPPAPSAVSSPTARIERCVFFTCFPQFLLSAITILQSFSNGIICRYDWKLGYTVVTRASHRNRPIWLVTGIMAFQFYDHPRNKYHESQLVRKGVGTLRLGV
jgi:hypothetical protein